MINRITIVGRCGTDAKVGQTKTGSDYARVNVATGKDKYTQWFQVTAYEKQAEWLAKATKGALIFVEGSVGLNTFKTSTGEHAANITVNAQVVRLLEKNEAPATEYVSTAAQDDDVPF